MTIRETLECNLNRRMKYTITRLAVAAGVMISTLAQSQGVKISEQGGNPDPASLFEVESTTRGFLPPRMTTAERDGILAPPRGLKVYNLDTDCENFFNGTYWMSVCGVCQPETGTPGQQAASESTATSFVANWTAAAGATGYRLDVSVSPEFSSYVSGFENLSVGNTTTFAVSGLEPGTYYHYRVRAEGVCGEGWSSTVTTANTKPVGIIDLYGESAAAYSVRLLRADYSGSLVRVRRSTDNAEQNIGADPIGNLDIQALTDFCGGGNCFVTTWYDQSGNNRNVIQPAPSLQPLIIETGVLVTQGARAATRWPNASQDYNMYFSDGGSLNSLRTTCSAFNVAKWSGGTGDFLWNMITNLVGVQGGNNNCFNAGFWDTPTARFGYHRANTQAIGVNVEFSSLADASHHSQYTVTFNDPNIQLWVNGPVSLTNSGALGASISFSNNGDLMIGRQWKTGNGSGVKSWMGTIQEVIYFPVIQSGSTRVDIENNQRSYFGI